MQWSPEFFSLLLGQSSHFIGISSPENERLVWVNNAGLQIFEIGKKQMEKGMSVKELFREVPLEFTAYCRNLQKKNDETFTGIYEFVTSKKTEFRGLFVCEPFAYAKQSYHLITIINAASLSTLSSDSGKDKERFRVLFDHATVGMLVTDHKGIISTLNPFAEIQFGYQKGELIGKTIEVLIPENLRMRHEELRTRFTQSPQNRPMGIGLDLYGRKKDGSTFPVEISLSHYEFNRQMFVIAFINDITVRKQAQENMLRQKVAAEKYSEEVKRLNEALERRVEERTTVLRETLHQLEKSKEELEVALEKEKELSDLKSRFVSMASHEFRTPLSTILSSASLIERYQGADDNEKRQRHIHRIKENVKNLNDILEDFLSLGKLEEGLIKPKQEPIGIADFISNIVHDVSEVKKDQQKFLYTHAGETEFPSDKYLLKNVLINLLSNAIKFSGDEDAIEVSSAVTKDSLTIRVKDHGIGISQDDQEHLFDRFFRGKNALNIKGTGLGLFIVSKYIELLNGSIECRSQLNEGTEFIITIYPIND